jgi:ketosteroid isomerase-like protein
VACTLIEGVDVMGQLAFTVAGRCILTVLAASSILLLPAGADAQIDGPAADAVRAREIAFAKTMQDRDLSAFLSFVAPDAVFFAGSTPLRGKAAIEEAWRGFFDGADPPFSWSPDIVQVLDSGGLALTSGPVADSSGQVVGRFNSIWRRDPDGVWRVVFDKGS